MNNYSVGELFENAQGRKLVYIGTRALPFLHNKKNLSFLKNGDFFIRDDKFLVNFKLTDLHVFLPVEQDEGVQYVYTSPLNFKFLQSPRLIKLKKTFSSLNLGGFDEAERNLKGMNSLSTACENLKNFNYYGFPYSDVGTTSVEVKLEDIVHLPVVENKVCGPCGKFYPSTQKIFNFMQFYEELLNVKTISGFFVNKDAKLVRFVVTQKTKLKFQFSFFEIGSNKSLTISAQTLFELRTWYKCIPFDDKNIDFICMAGTSNPSGDLTWELMDIEVVHK